jgi:hypothetical protein
LTNSSGRTKIGGVANTVRPASDAWVTTEAEPGVTAHFRLGRLDGHTVVTEMFVSAPEIDTDLLRRLQPSRVVAAVDGELAEDGAKAKGTVSRLLSQQTVADGHLTLGELRARKADLPAIRSRPRLNRRQGATGVDQFYGDVAVAYRSAAAESNKPAVLLAEENGIPVETVRRWIKEARRRGHLPAGRRGRAQ